MKIGDKVIILSDGWGDTGYIEAIENGKYYIRTANEYATGWYYYTELRRADW